MPGRGLNIKPEISGIMWRFMWHYREPPGAVPAPCCTGLRAALFEQQREKEVRGALVVGSLVQVVHVEAWTTRAGASMSSGYVSSQQRTGKRERAPAATVEPIRVPRVTSAAR